MAVEPRRDDARRAEATLGNLEFGERREKPRRQPASCQPVRRSPARAGRWPAGASHAATAAAGGIDLIASMAAPTPAVCRARRRRQWRAAARQVTSGTAVQDGMNRCCRTVRSGNVGVVENGVECGGQFGLAGPVVCQRQKPDHDATGLTRQPRGDQRLPGAAKCGSRNSWSDRPG